MNISSKEILKYLKEERQVWIGKEPPYDMCTLDLLGASNFRASSAHHHKYNVVWLYEKLVDDIGATKWKILLDESLRLIGEDGFLIVKMRMCGNPTLPYLKSFIGRRYGIQASIDLEFQDIETEVYTIVFKIHRLNVEKYADDSWTFAMLTGGKKKENVLNFIKSIRDNEKHRESEIIIVGPQDDEYDSYGVEYIDTNQFRDDRYAEISRKKNTVIDRAKGANLFIVHDRFMLREDFFDGFDRWGYDFDIATVSQFMKTGGRYPGYARLDELMKYTSPTAIFDYSNVYETSYINGGLVILKTHSARDIGFNQMLMWSQMEDVELSKVYMDRGLVPRVNYASSALVLEISEGYFRGWKNENGTNFIQANRIVFGEKLHMLEGHKFINEVYKQILDRKPENERVIEKYSKQLLSGKDKNELILEIRVSDEGMRIGISISELHFTSIKRAYLEQFNGENFIEACYLGILGRTADSEGRKYFIDKYINGDLTKSDVIDSMMKSPEGQKNGVIVI